MIKLIFPYDSIDDGRKKINGLIFTGYTANGYWKSLNSGATGFSLEFSASTANVSSSNVDNSFNSNNIIVGDNNTGDTNGGYNFIKGNSNYIKNSFFSYIDGYNNNLTGLTSSFVLGENNKIFSGTNIVFMGNNNVDAKPNIFLNNSSILSSYNSVLSGNSSMSNSNFLSIYCNDNFNLTGKTDFVSILNGTNNSISGNVTNSIISGVFNSIGLNYASNSNNIFIFGSGLTPSLSATTLSPLSGTYINDLCINNSVINNVKIELLGSLPLTTTKKINFENKNIFILSSATNVNPYAMIISAETLNNVSNQELTGLFFATYKNAGRGIRISGDTSFFYDNYNGANNNRWDLPGNFLSANTVFMTYFGDINRFIKYKG